MPGSTVQNTRFAGAGNAPAPTLLPLSCRARGAQQRQGERLIHSSKVLWGEGLFLRPQHFQRQDAYHEWRLAETARALHPFAWGLRRLRVDTDALATGTLRVPELQLVMPDGELFDAPADDELPDDVSLSSVAAGVSELVFHAALPPMRAHAANFSGAGKEAREGVRYVQHNQEANDWFTSAEAAEVAVLRRRLRLLPHSEPREHLVSMPLLRLRRSATGAFELDAGFIPPALSIVAVPALQTMLRRLLDTLQAKVDALYGHHREPSKHVIEFRSGDIASFWLLHTASSAFAALSHLHHHPGLHPERLYERLLELAGALMTFSKRYALSNLKPYSHDAPEGPFHELDGMLRELLETVISTRYFAIALDLVKPSFHHGRLDSQKITPATQLILGVQAAVPATELVEMIPLRLKVGAPDDVDRLVLSAMAGVRLSHLPQVPPAIPVRPGTHYFQLEPRGPLYERMLQAQTISLYAPSGIPEFSPELLALND
jgi:type VI secretion system protein ImpJ